MNGNRARHGQRRGPLSAVVRDPRTLVVADAFLKPSFCAAAEVSGGLRVLQKFDFIQQTDPVALGHLDLEHFCVVYNDLEHFGCVSRDLEHFSRYRLQFNATT